MFTSKYYISNHVKWVHEVKQQTELSQSTSSEMTFRPSFTQVFKKIGNEFECPFCLKLFKTRYFAERHVAIIHEGKKIIKHKPYPKTSDATKINSSIDPLNLNNFPCFICSEVFSYKCDVNKHIATAHGGKKIPISFYMRSNKIQDSEDSGLNLEENSKSNKTIGASEKCPTCQEKNCDLKNSCVVYAEFITKVDSGYQCKLCFHELPIRKQICTHISEKHNLELRDKILAESRKISNVRPGGRPLSLKEDSKAKKTIEASEECPTCKEKFRKHYLANKHSKSCAIYSEFLTKVENGYQCKLCLRELPQRSYMGNHIREKHNLELRDKILAKRSEINFDVNKTMTLEKPQTKSEVLKQASPYQISTSDEKKINYPQVTMVHEGKKHVTHEPYQKTIDGKKMNSSIDSLNSNHFPCFICSEVFLYKCDVNKHIGIAHGGNKLPRKVPTSYGKSNWKEKSRDPEDSKLMTVGKNQIKNEPIDYNEQDLPSNNQDENTTIPKEFSETFEESQTFTDPSELCKDQIKEKNVNKMMTLEKCQIKSEPIDYNEQDLPSNNQDDNKTIPEEFSETFEESETFIDPSELCKDQIKEKHVNKMMTVEKHQIKSEPIDYVEQDLHSDNQYNNAIIEEEFSEPIVESETFIDPSELCKVQIKEKKFKCPTCLKGFESKVNVKRHFQEVHEKKKRPVEIRPRGRPQKEISGIEQSPSKIPDKPFQCSLCSKAFKLKAVLKRHFEQVHDKIKPFHCSFCPSKFGYKFELEKHLSRIHEGKNQDAPIAVSKEKFKCHNCDKIFSVKNTLNYHMEYSCKGKEGDRKR